jgi:hypothetical protein
MKFAVIAEILYPGEELYNIDKSFIISIWIIPQSDVPIDLLDVDKNSAVVSYSACDVEVEYHKSTVHIQWYSIIM